MGLSAEELVARVTARFGEAVTETHHQHGEATAVIARDAAPQVFRTLRDDAELAFDFLTDITAVDYLGQKPRFTVVYHLYSLAENHRLRVKVRALEDDAWVHSLTGLWRTANWLERECWDMYGIRFVGHPDPRRILMYEEFVGHPLRKDYPVEKRQPLTEERDPIEIGWKV
jgi:NADH-quinone oxidoreductase subunit C